MDSLEAKKLATDGSYSGGYQGNFHNLKIAHQAVIRF
jgi:hypothetical protein